MVMVMVLDVSAHTVWTKLAVAVTVPGAHFAVKTPADANSLVRMTGAVQLTAPAIAARRNTARRSKPFSAFTRALSPGSGLCSC